MKKFKQLPIPKDCAWDRPNYDPIAYLYSLKKYNSTLNFLIFNPYFEIKWFFRQLFNYIKNVVIWTPILWKDRNWDDQFIFDVLQHKLNQQRKCLVKENRHLGISETNRDITNCLNLIELYKTGYYESEYQDYLKEDLVFEKLHDEKGNELDYREVKCNLISDNLLDYIEKYKTTKNLILKKYPEYSNYKLDSDDRRSLAFHMSSFRHKKCKMLLFYILEEKIDHWWD